MCNTFAKLDTKLVSILHVNNTTTFGVIFNTVQELFHFFWAKNICSLGVF